MQTLNCIYNCNLGTTASQEGLHLEKNVYPYTLFFPYNKGKNCVPLHSFDITVHCFHEEESLLKGYMHYKFTYSLTRDQPQKCAKPFIIKWLKYNTFPSSAQLLQYGKVEREAQYLFSHEHDIIGNQLCFTYLSTDYVLSTWCVRQLSPAS